MGVATATAVAAGVGALGSVVGGVINANSQSDAARQRANAAAQQEDFARQQIQNAAPSATELAELDKQIQLKDRSIARQEELIKAIDPAILEASQQSLKLLRGESTGATAVIERARERQRAQLESRLRDRLGSGYDASTTGIDALGRFEEGTAAQMQQAQMQALGSVGNFLSTAKGARPSEESLLNMSNVPLQNAMNMKNRQAGVAASFFGGIGRSAQGQAGMSDTAGGIAGGIAKLGGTLLGAGLSSLGSSSSPGGVSGSADSNGPNLGVIPKGDDPFGLKG